VTSGLDTLYVSLDGASAGTYRQYRVGGDFDRVVANVGLLAAARKRLRNFHTRLIWKMVIFDYNRSEMKAQAATYRELGFDSYLRVIDRHSPQALAIAERQNRKMVENRRACFWLWNTMVVTAQGDVYPCCKGDKFELGNAIDEGVRAVWRGPAYQALRLAFSARTYGKDMHPVCKKCIGLEKSSPA
jgi:radical SAM protein with 4Fe4S-binding SPASM domain